MGQPSLSLGASAFQPSFTQAAAPQLSLATPTFTPSVSAEQKLAKEDAEANALFSQALPSLAGLLQSKPFVPPASPHQRKSSQDLSGSRND